MTLSGTMTGQEANICILGFARRDWREKVGDNHRGATERIPLPRAWAPDSPVRTTTEEPKWPRLSLRFPLN